MKQIVILLALLSLIQGRTLHNQLSGYTFEHYVVEFNKVYDAEEYQLRKVIFETNLHEIINHNAQPDVSYKMGVNDFTDHTNEERQVVNGHLKSLGRAYKAASNSQVFKATGTVKLPDSFDWRDVSPSVVSPVKNQGRCGSCWTFASAATLESHWAIATGHLEHFSEQQLASCTPNPLHCGGFGGCKGGIAQLAYQHVIDNGGIASEWTYPYISYPGQDYDCKFNQKTTPAAAQFESYVSIQENSYEALMEALVTKGPIAVNVDASSWHNYESGVFDGCDLNNIDVNHVVQLVGYGTDPVHGDYWTIRNSWSPSYGENGYIRIKRTKQGELCGVDKQPQDGTGCDGGPAEVTVCGMCGILYDGSYPVPKSATKVEAFLE